MSISSEKARSIFTTPEKAVELSRVGKHVTNRRTKAIEFRASYLIFWRPKATTHHDNTAIAYEV